MELGCGAPKLSTGASPCKPNKSPVLPPPRLNTIIDANPRYNISFALKRIVDGTIDKDCAQDIAQSFRVAAESLVAVLQDALESSYEGADKADRVIALQTVSDLMEAAGLIDRLFEEA